MSHLGNSLKALLEKKKIKANQLALMSGVSDAILSRTVRGETSISSENLEKVLLIVSDNAAEQAELIRAHLLDQLAELNLESVRRVRIELLGAPAATARETSLDDRLWPDELRRAFAILAENAHVPELARVILDVALLFESTQEKPATRKAPAGPVKYPAHRAQVSIIEETGKKPKK